MGPVGPDRFHEPLKPTGATLTDAQLSWLFQLEGEALRDQRRLSHSEIVRLAIDRQRQQDVSTVAARIDQGPPPYAVESTFDLAVGLVPEGRDPFICWRRDGSRGRSETLPRERHLSRVRPGSLLGPFRNCPFQSWPRGPGPKTKLMGVG